MFGKLTGPAAALLLCCVAALASAATVGEVKFDQKGGNPLQPELLLGNIQLQPGVTFSRRALDEDVKRLYATGNFADVAAEDAAQGDKVNILFKVRLKPRIVSIRFEGNAKYQAFELGKEITLVEGGLLKDRNYVESRDKLLEFYRKKGFTEATVTPIIMPRNETEVDLVFKVDEKLKQKVDKVTFEGATVYTERELRGSVANQYSYWNWLPFVNDYLNRGLLDRRELDLDRARLREKYYEKGYLDFKIDSVAVTRQADDPEYVDVAFKLTEGEPYKVGKVTVKGNAAFAESEIMPLILLTEGAVFSSALEQESARRITANYETLGYSDISCHARRNADFNTHTVDVEFEIVEGRKFFVRDVLITGNTYTKDKVIRRELAIEPGDPADKNRIEVSRQRLMGMGYFDKVEARPVGADALDEKDVVFNVKEKEDRYKLRFGAGASDVNSVFGMAEISTDNFDILDPGNWFYGGGQRFRVQGVLGIDNAGFNVDFVEPWLFDLPLRFEASAYMNRVVYENWDENRVGFRTSLSRKFFDNFTSATIGYKFERVNVTDIAHSIRPYLEADGQLDPQFVSQPSLSLTRDTRNSITNPTSGYNINLFLSVTPKALGSSHDYYRLEAKG
ncbi:MAG: outer membrane protein assembly factor BamA, partial [Victivallaceae bacterium]|nr:outer membrane protein assembly factor BamA [Victivallaceae bacterium]